MELLHVGAFSTCVRQPDRHDLMDSVFQVRDHGAKLTIDQLASMDA